MTDRFAQACSRGCDFLIAVQGHDFETIQRGVEAYGECPNCGSKLEKRHMYEDPVTGTLKIAEGGQDDQC